MNPSINELHPYPFEKLAKLLADITPNKDLELIKLTIGEPQHPAPQFVLDTLAQNLDKVSKYPGTKGTPELRQSIANWASKRFQLSQLDPDTQVLPVTGTREALFAITQTLVDSTKPNATVISPNPFYQIYEGATILAGAKLHFLAGNPEQNYKIDYTDISDEVWQDTQILFTCSPNNPNGYVTTLKDYEFLLKKSAEFDFTIIADECYSEIYFDENTKPTGLLEACQRLDNQEYKNCLVFHSLSKRSNLPGLRSGFVAGDADILASFLLYRTYHGCAMALQTQIASISAWNDEEHVLENRNLYREKFEQVLEILTPVMKVSKPDAGFYLWPQLDIDDEVFCQKLYQEEAVLVLPGRYLAREVEGINPAKNHVRMALVATTQDCVEAASRIKRFMLKHTK
ncbi:succinyldiaminopimelate aminotransferase [Marinomonas sp. SBI22]|uniref:succinyldiaminopimelate transaminase n=1 Tax=unclassified Marinomonas TaxID=196814 RepID=UPI0007AF786D|nr:MULTISPECIES: succinyldiaminopimelate transaminase [unclassified Marinomonas]KZM40761.1 succinyldiaminopimelate aminotransferase [Marinomonas sp. SBI8L]KZM46055.1 succinyldiaminopimelate aminotransferase [Marinomonas sp. SBI22]